MHLTKNLILIALVSLLLAHIAAAQDAQKRNSLLAKRAGNKNIFQKSTTTTPEPAAYEDEEYPEGLEGDLEQHEDDDQHSSTTTTTTEAPKKMIRPSVRPMRSNEDLLSALKKRRLSQKSNKPAVTQKPVQEEKQQYEPVEVKTQKPKPSIASGAGGNAPRRFGGHKSANVKAPVQDNHAQTIEEPASKTFKRSNRFTVKTN